MFGSILNAVTSPVTDTVEFVSDLTQGKINTGAATRIAADIAVGYAVSELIEAVVEDDDE